MHRYDGESWAEAAWRRAASHLWIERQIILRSGGRVRTVVLPRPAQAAGLLVGLGVAGWLGYATAVFMDAEQLATGRDRMSEHDRAQFAQVLAHNDELRMSLATVEHQLSGIESERKHTEDRNAKLAGQVAKLEQHADRAEAKNTTLRIELQSASQKLASAAGERQEAERERETLQDRIAELESRLAQIHVAQEGLVRRMSESTAKEIASAENLLAKVGISPNQVVKRPARSGVGGPFVPARRGDGETDAFGRSVVALLDRLERRDALHGAVESLPLDAPLASYSIGSPFGHRRDPFNGSAAFHQGLDLSAERKTPVHSPAAGTVKTVIVEKRVGRMVEVDHGHNIVTRYAHLSASKVKVGQKVGKGDVLGLVGSTGRTTGPHLHYEVLVNGRPMDPMRFMKAGKHVRKG